MHYRSTIFLLQTCIQPPQLVTLNFTLCVAWILLSSHGLVILILALWTNQFTYIQHLHSQCSHHCSTIRLKSRLNKIKLLYVHRPTLTVVSCTTVHACVIEGLKQFNHHCCITFHIVFQRIAWIISFAQIHKDIMELCLICSTSLQTEYSMSTHFLALQIHTENPACA